MRTDAGVVRCCRVVPGSGIVLRAGWRTDRIFGFPLCCKPHRLAYGAKDDENDAEPDKDAQFRHRLPCLDEFRICYDDNACHHKRPAGKLCHNLEFCNSSFLNASSAQAILTCSYLYQPQSIMAMRILCSEEAQIAGLFYQMALHAAHASGCRKSQRGVVYVLENIVRGTGTNGPPAGYACDGNCCYMSSRIPVHAEIRAMRGNSVRGATGYHAKLKNGIAVDSEGPGCVDCAKEMVDAGVSDFVLRQREGFVLYSAREMYELSAQKQLDYDISSRMRPNEQELR
jgi:deoxycytidylate deaminase